MLNLRIKTAKINGRVKMKCEKHPTYNPQTGGKGAIRAGCPRCFELYAVFADYLALQEAIGKVNNHLDENGVRYTRVVKKEEDEDVAATA